METERLNWTLEKIAEFYDAAKVGYEGTEGYRKSTDLSKLTQCALALVASGLLSRQHTLFEDLGCADGRVNVLMSYFVKKSIGIEIDSEILNEYTLRKNILRDHLQEAKLILPPDNISLFPGSSLEPDTHERIFSATGVRFSDVDLFYTYITLHDLFAEKIVGEAKRGALYLVYGFSKVLPHYQGLEILIADVASQGIAALYRKE